MPTPHPNIEILEFAAARLGPVLGELVFLGGCATGLLITDPGAPRIRATRDVDAITEVASLGDYHGLTDRLRRCGFREDLSDDAPICRWVSEAVILDLMPTDPRILGFGNRWYRPAVHNAIALALPSGTEIRCVSAPYFLATKLEAFDGRGNGDYLMSHDIEDLVAVLDGRKETVDEVAAAPQELANYLSQRFAELLEKPAFRDSLPGHLSPDQAGQARLSIVIERISAISSM
jgi:hypothetical protein